MKFVTIREAAAITGLATSYIRAGCVHGEIPHVKSGVKYWVNLEALIEKLEADSRASVKTAEKK